MLGGATRQTLPARIGRYDVVGHIASGGMAELFLGIEPPSTRPVAIKRILPHLARQAEFVTMFLDEARIGARVRHPSLVDVYELGEVGGDLFLVMEYLEGENLASMIRRLLARGQQIPYAIAAHIVREAAIALGAAHGESIIHRDVSPQNVFVTYDGDVKVLDFGIATAASRLAHTAAGQLKGKFQYMSPEQSRGEALDPRSDVFSLGIVLYELTMQRTLFRRASELMILKAVCEEPIPRPSRDLPSYPHRLEEICLRALSRDRERRQSSMYALADELRGAIDLDDPHASLRALMGSLFDDRRNEKSQMLRRVRAVSSFEELGSLPAAETDENVDMPQISIEGAPGDDAPRSRWPWLVAAALAIGGIAGVITLVHSPDEIAARLPVRPHVVEAPAPPPPPRAYEATVGLHVVSTPPATLRVDGIDRGTTPVDLVLPQTTQAVLELARPGYLPQTQTIAVDRAESLSFALAPVPRPPAKKPAKAFHRFK